MGIRAKRQYQRCYHRGYQKDLRLLKRENGICSRIGCEKDVVEGGSMCEKHRQWWVEYRKGWEKRS